MTTLSPIPPPKVSYSPVRLLTVPAFDYFHVCALVSYDTFGEVGLPLVERAYRLRDESGLTTASCLVLRYLETPGVSQPFPMQAGFMVAPHTPAPEGAQVIHLEPFTCAVIMVYGDGVIGSYKRLDRAIAKHGYRATGESREWNLFRETTTFRAEEDSPYNISYIQFGVEKIS